VLGREPRILLRLLFQKGFLGIENGKIDENLANARLRIVYVTLEFANKGVNDLYGNPGLRAWV
jgi:hypothetical protein